MPSLEGEYRFLRINAFLAASLNAALAASKIRPTRNLTFQDANQQYIADVLLRSMTISNYPPIYLREKDANYLFHLESELWGIDFRNYAYFISQRRGASEVLETFKLVHSFMLMERWLHQTFLSPEQRKENETHKPGRASKRRLIFGKDRGLLTCKHKDCLAALGSPFCLLGSTSGASHITVGSTEWAGLHATSIPTSLQNFYEFASGQRHFCPIVEGAYKSAREKLPRQIWPSEKRIPRKKTKGLKSTWYDVWWIYSESVRYRALHPAQVYLSQPFHWNRSLRWCTSLMISGFLCLIHKGDDQNILKTAWNRARRRNAIVYSVFGESRNAIF